MDSEVCRPKADHSFLVLKIQKSSFFNLFMGLSNRLSKPQRQGTLKVLLKVLLRVLIGLLKARLKVLLKVLIRKL